MLLLLPPPPPPPLLPLLLLPLLLLLLPLRLLVLVLLLLLLLLLTRGRGGGGEEGGLRLNPHPGPPPHAFPCAILLSADCQIGALGLRGVCAAGRRCGRRWRSCAKRCARCASPPSFTPVAPPTPHHIRLAAGLRPRRVRESESQGREGEGDDPMCTEAADRAGRRSQGRFE
jgi:hypothetical protein